MITALYKIYIPCIKNLKLVNNNKKKKKSRVKRGEKRNKKLKTYT